MTLTTVVASCDPGGGGGWKTGVTEEMRNDGLRSPRLLLLLRAVEQRREEVKGWWGGEGGLYLKINKENPHAPTDQCGSPSAGSLGDNVVRAQRRVTVQRGKTVLNQKIPVCTAALERKTSGVSPPPPVCECGGG